MFEESEAARPWLQRFLISRNARLILLSNQIVVPPGTRSPMRCIKFSAVTVLSSSASTVFPNQSKRFKEVMLVNRVPAEWLKIYLEKQNVHVDHAIRFCKRTVRPFEWEDVPYDPECEPRTGRIRSRRARVQAHVGLVRSSARAPLVRKPSHMLWPAVVGALPA
jgi:hypothetical protein